MKKFFYPHIVLLFLGRFFFLFLNVFSIVLTVNILRIFVDNFTITAVFYILFLLGLDFLCLWLTKYFWQQIWGKLILEEDRIVWKCLFCKTVSIPYSSIRHVSIHSFYEQNVIRYDIYKTGFCYCVISKSPCPIRRVDKVKCSNGTIKWMCSEKFCLELMKKIPPQYSAPISRYLKNHKRK